MSARLRSGSNCTFALFVEHHELAVERHVGQRFKASRYFRQSPAGSPYRAANVAIEAGVLDMDEVREEEGWNRAA